MMKWTWRDVRVAICGALVIMAVVTVLVVITMYRDNP